MRPGGCQRDGTALVTVQGLGVLGWPEKNARTWDMSSHSLARRGGTEGALDPSVSAFLLLLTERTSGRLAHSGEKTVCSRDAFTLVVRLGERISDLQPLWPLGRGTGGGWGVKLCCDQDAHEALNQDAASCLPRWGGREANGSPRSTWAVSVAPGQFPAAALGEFKDKTSPGTLEETWVKPIWKTSGISP